ncbi:uncharacterized protein LOC134224034 [Armigeres subalbatus]|uniref:uncharacterized protein LOC134224034 n=1 Tax=Armigeres subalbatus TaxID=124917 RepID=UPI002ED2D50D
MSDWFDEILNSATVAQHFIADDAEDALFAETSQDGNEQGRRGSRPGRSPNVDRMFSFGHDKIYNDYFRENCVYNEETFELRFRIPKNLFLEIMQRLQDRYEYFRLRHDATGKPGLSTLQKCTAAIRLLAYGSSADSIDENVRIATSTALETLRHFCTGIIEIYGSEYLRPPNAEECRMLMAENAIRGFPGMIASIDCMHWIWKACPVAWKGQYQGKEGKATIVLEACASYNTYVWHCFFGSPGTLNDVNVLDRSHLVHDIVERRSLGGSWEIGNHEYERGYLLADGIYPDWSVFLKTISMPQTAKEKLFANSQEAARKDVERCFSNIQGTWQIIGNPCRLFDVKSMQDVITTCIILHNMRIKFRSTVNECFEQNPNRMAGFVAGSAPTLNIGFLDFLDQRQTIKDSRLHFQLRQDIIEHLWAVKGNSVDS